MGRSQGIDERDVNSERLRKSVGVERTLAEDIHEWSDCEAIIEHLYPELERRLAIVKPDLLIARQGVKLKFNDFQQTTQEHVWPQLNKEDLITTARKTRRASRRARRMAGGATRNAARPSIGTTVGVRVISQAIKILSLLRLRHLNFSITIPAFSHSQ